MRVPVNKLAEFRMRNLMSQDDVAQKLEISQAYYGRLEKKPLKMDVGMMVKLKAMFKAESIEQLIEDAV
jgi:DNA-binding XRE family transcriptional regulator